MINEKNNNMFLDIELLKQYRDIINSTNIFYEDLNLKSKWNLICTVLDRLESSAKWLNEHSNTLKK